VKVTSLPYAVPAEFVAKARKWYRVLRDIPLRELVQELAVPLLVHGVVGLAVVA
jgi:hypothetical protein